ncbi:MAG: hypothetical protein J0H77_03125, partial [Alphaproteobacteria bacterium]|nr:hypothetical protein [Alphaproteobacteria bacterium]
MGQVTLSLALALEAGGLATETSLAGVVIGKNPKLRIGTYWWRYSSPPNSFQLLREIRLTEETYSVF